MSSDAIAIEARDLRARRAGRDGVIDVLDGIDLDAAAGEAVGVVGPSGCGKSTLLGVLAGLEEPLSGEVLLDGAPAPDRLGRLALMPQKDALLPWRTAAENVAAGARLAGAGAQAAQAAAVDALRRLGLAGFEDHYPHALSGGMRQRVALARTLAADSGGWLLDEPFGAVDALTRAALRRSLTEARLARGATLVLVTHDVEEALVLADRVLVTSPRPARVVAEIPVALEHPRDPDVAASAEVVRLRAEVLHALRATGALA